MEKVLRCIYCDGPCKVTTEGGKLFAECKECGKRELTKLGLARMEAREKLK